MWQVIVNNDTIASFSPDVGLSNNWQRVMPNPHTYDIGSNRCWIAQLSDCQRISLKSICFLMVKTMIDIRWELRDSGYTHALLQEQEFPMSVTSLG